MFFEREEESERVVRGRERERRKKEIEIENCIRLSIDRSLAELKNL